MCDSCGFEDLLEEVDEAIESGDYHWCLETLEGIREWVAQNEHCTDKQKESVSNILACGR